VEGYDIPSGKANVIVCDGFVGNIVVKFCESLGKTVAGWLEEKIGGKLAENEMKEITEGLLRATNAAEVSGGGPLWAVNGVACVSHGRSRHQEIARTIEQARLAVERDLVGTLKTELAAARQKLKEAGLEIISSSETQ
jgi:glycerol-3-phosphate acyltransferase PlsX